MKKEASVILAKCAQDKLYGIRIEKRDNDWVRTWAFKLKEETAEKEGFDKINFTGSFYTDEEYPGCPYCGAKKCFVCGNCGKVIHDILKSLLRLQMIKQSICGYK